MEPRLLEERLKNLPARPGVYLMKDAADQVIYVGKAVDLHSRVRSYFGSPAGQTPKTRRLVEHIADFEYIVTGTDLEALLLECNLIKQYRPHYNVLLKDDKHYPYIKIDVQNDWPRVYLVRRMERDGARYFGPFTDSRSVWNTLRLLKKLFPYRYCDKPITGKDVRPCLDYFIHRCTGPCTGAVTREEYHQVIRQVILFLEGKHEDVLSQLQAKMLEAAENLEFERAAVLRDQIQAVEKVSERQRVVSAAMEDQDVIAFAREDGQACVEVFLIRGGKIIGREHFVLEGTQDEDDGQVLSSFVEQFYDSATYVPPTILVQNQIDEMAIIQQWLRQRRGDKVAIEVPRGGDQGKLLEMVAENAREVLAQMRARWLADTRKTLAALEELQEHLGLPTLPGRIECYDISNIQGVDAVGSMVVFEQGQPLNAHYRRFRIKTVEGANDYAMMQEVLQRRFKRLTAGRRGSAEAGKKRSQGSAAKTLPLAGLDVGAAGNNEARKPEVREAEHLASHLPDFPSSDPFQVLPDLLMVDGGKGQLNVARQVLRDAGADFVPLAALAKENEEIYLPGQSEPVVLPRTSQALYLVQRIRDEAHRFALAYHTRVHGRNTFRSALDEVPGLGPKRRAALLRRFGTVQAIREATIEDLASVPGMTLSQARRLKEKL